MRLHGFLSISLDSASVIDIYLLVLTAPIICRHFWPECLNWRDNPTVLVFWYHQNCAWVTSAEPSPVCRAESVHEPASSATFQFHSGHFPNGLWRANIASLVTTSFLPSRIEGIVENLLHRNEIDVRLRHSCIRVPPKPVLWSSTQANSDLACHSSEPRLRAPVFAVVWALFDIIPKASRCGWASGRRESSGALQNPTPPAFARVSSFASNARRRMLRAARW